MYVKQYNGTWRSYKTFSVRGDVKLHKENCYSEVTINEAEDLTLFGFPNLDRKQVFKKSDWEVRATEGRHFLYLNGKKAFEVITLEQRDLVLQDLVTYEKIILALLPLWNERLHPQRKIERKADLEIWSKSLVEIIKRKD